MTIDAVGTLVGRQIAAEREPHDLPAELPSPRGPMTTALLDYLRCDPASTRVDPGRLTWSGATAEAATDHDLQLALWLAYELPYRGLAGVDDAWERHPGLVEVIGEWEDLLLDALVGATAIKAASGNGVSPLSQALTEQATLNQFRELLVHRSIYYLKGTDPHTWAIPRLKESVNAAIAALRAEVDDSAITADADAQRFRSLL